MIILLNRTGKKWNKNPTQDKSLKLLHTGYIKTESEGKETQKRKQKTWKIRTCNDPMGEVYLYTQY